MSFAFTTSPAGQQQESVARYLTMPSRMVELGQTSAGHTTGFVAALVPGAAEAQAPSTVPSLVGSLIPVPDPSIVAALEAAQAAALATEAAASIEVAPPPPAEVAVAAAVTHPPVVEPALVAGDRVTATLSFYYCEVGPKGRHVGDGGNFCGHMRDGTIVYDGAAACAYAYLGQQFRIIGDPTARVYRCADTGSAVHGQHRDIWFMSSDEGWEWQLQVGQVATIEILP